MRDGGVKAIAEALKVNTGLKHLELGERRLKNKIMCSFSHLF